MKPFGSFDPLSGSVQSVADPCFDVRSRTVCVLNPKELQSLAEHVGSGMSGTSGLEDTNIIGPMESLFEGFSGRPNSVTLTPVDQVQGAAIAMSLGRQFTFDAVIGRTGTQEDVYNAPRGPREVVGMFCKKNQGYNGCIAAFGQTGAGKTYTMIGNLQAQSPGSGTGTDNDPDCSLEGVIPRAFRQIFCFSKGNKSTAGSDAVGCELSTEAAAEGKGEDLSESRFEVKMSCLEIYNSKVFDLLVAESNLTPLRGGRLALRVRSGGEDVGGSTYVEGLSEVVIRDADEGIGQLKLALQARVNVLSSHAQFVCCLKLCRVASPTCTLWLVDLCGSQRRSNATHLKESQHIGSNLSALGNVIHCLARKARHIPYRDSPLTYMLKDAFGGPCNTILIGNVGPGLENCAETLCTARFIQRATLI